MYICIYCRFPIRDHLEALLCDDRQQDEYRAAVRSDHTIYFQGESCSHQSTVYESGEALSSLQKASIQLTV